MSLLSSPLDNDDDWPQYTIITGRAYADNHVTLERYVQSVSDLLKATAHAICKRGFSQSAWNGYWEDANNATASTMSSASPNLNKNSIHCQEVCIYVVATTVVAS